MTDNSIRVAEARRIERSAILGYQVELGSDTQDINAWQVRQVKSRADLHLSIVLQQKCDSVDARAGK